MSHPILSSDELLRFADEHLRYEIDMLIGTAYSNFAVDQFVTNIRIESFGIHLRNLIDFFYLVNPQQDDVVAARFFSGATIGASLIPPISQNLEHARSRVNKELSHLTTKRIEGYSPQKVWEFDVLTKEIVVLLKIFESNAEPNTLSESLRQYIRSL